MEFECSDGEIRDFARQKVETARRVAAAAAKLKNHGSANTYCDIAFTFDDGNELQYDELRPFVCGRYTHCPACGKEEALRANACRKEEALRANVCGKEEALRANACRAVLSYSVLRD